MPHFILITYIFCFDGETEVCNRSPWKRLGNMALPGDKFSYLKVRTIVESYVSGHNGML